MVSSLVCCKVPIPRPSHVSAPWNLKPYSKAEQLLWCLEADTNFAPVPSVCEGNEGQVGNRAAGGLILLAGRQKLEKLLLTRTSPI